MNNHEYSNRDNHCNNHRFSGRRIPNFLSIRIRRGLLSPFITHTTKLCNCVSVPDLTAQGFSTIENPMRDVLCMNVPELTVQRVIRIWGPHVQCILHKRA